MLPVEPGCLAEGSVASSEHGDEPAQCLRLSFHFKMMMPPKVGRPDPGEQSPRLAFNLTTVEAAPKRVLMGQI